MRIGEVAERARVGVETLRYYERRGLLDEPRRLSSGYRAYPDEAVQVVRFIRRAQQLGFTLTEIGDLLTLADGRPDPCESVRALAYEKIGDLDRKITDMLAMRAALDRLAQTCDRPRPDRECPLLRAIEETA